MNKTLAVDVDETLNSASAIDSYEMENILYLTKFPKIGEKLAKQIILDLKGKIYADIEDSVDDNNTEELMSVLENLGYKMSEIKKVIPQVDSSKSLEDQVKEALKLLLKSN